VEDIAISKRVIGSGDHHGMTKRLAATGLVLVLSGCGSDGGEPPDDTTTGTGGGTPVVCESEEWRQSDGSCVPPPYLPACPPGTIEREGSCVPPGVPPELCGEGFESDGDGGCIAVAPEAACGDGKRAPLGQTDCVPIGDCGAGIWGAIPIEADTQFVDASYSGGGSDGSQGAPWTTVQEGIDAASEGAIVAVAAGSYEGTFLIEGKGVRLWGRCPDMVAINGVDPVGIYINDGAHGTELRGLAVTSEYFGVVVRGSEDVLFEEMWIHDVDWRGVQADAMIGPTSLTIERSLIERASDVAVLSFGADVALEDTEIRDTRPDPQTGGFGRAVGLQVDPDSGAASSGSVRGVVLRNNRDVALWAAGATLSVDETWIVDTQPELGAETDGAGIGAAAVVYPSVVDVRSTVIERQHMLGAYALSSELALDGVSIRQIAPQLSNGEFGRGVSVETDEGAPRANLDMRRSVVDDTYQIGIGVTGADFTIAECLVRDSKAQQSNDLYGRSVGAQDEVMTGERSEGSIADSLLTGYAETALIAVSSDLVAERVAIRDATTLSSSPFGDGIVAMALGPPATATLRTVHVDRSARAAVGAFGATLSVETSLLECNPIDMNGDDIQGVPFSFTDAGGNLCGCEGLAHACKLQSASLEPPVAQ
jgi:hypothetical protein